MLTAEVRRRVAAFRQPGASVRLARVLWLTLAIIVWNVVFDQVIAAAGRYYIAAAERAAMTAGGTPSFVDMDEWMRPAVTRGLWTASASAAVIFVTGVLLVRAASSK